jgi:hypothetical protein
MQTFILRVQDIDRHHVVTEKEYRLTPTEFEQSSEQNVVGYNKIMAEFNRLSREVQAAVEARDV